MLSRYSAAALASVNRASRLPRLRLRSSCSTPRMVPHPSGFVKYIIPSSLYTTVGGAASRTSGAEPVLQRPLDTRVERVEPVQRQRLGGGKATRRRRLGPVVAEQAVRDRQPAG